MDRPNQGLHDTHMTKNKPPSSAPAVDHGHDHEHVHTLLPPEPALRVKALESILVEKGLVDPAALDAIIDFYERDIGPHIGAGLVARAWADDTFRAALLADADAVIDGLGHGGRQGEHVVVVENTPSVHNMVVCTLCSCYPWPLLGIPPAWYKSDAYRSRAVREPRRQATVAGGKHQRRPLFHRRPLCKAHAVAEVGEFPRTAPTERSTRGEVGGSEWEDWKI